MAHDKEGSEKGLERGDEEAGAPFLGEFSMPFGSATYWLYEFAQAALNPSRAIADATRLFLSNPANPLAHTTYGKSVAATSVLFERTTRQFARPGWQIDSTIIDGKAIPIKIDVVWEQPFCRLLHFKRDLDPDLEYSAPKLLIVPPMAGHYATVLRETVSEFLPNYDVYVSEWVNARDVPVSKGRFDLDDYIDYVISMMQSLGENLNVVAVCQSVVPVLAAVSLIEANDLVSPKSMTLIAGTVDARINPTMVGEVVRKKGVDWYERNTICKVPFPYSGFGRDVYPGFLQLHALMSLTLDRHIEAHRDYFRSLVKGDSAFANVFLKYYDEYLAFMDLTAEFFLQTLETVFAKHSMAIGEMSHRGVPVNLSDIRRTALLTIEGEFDAIASVGQTEVAHALCINIPQSRKAHWLQPSVGHYGVFNGNRFANDIRPRIDQFITSQQG